MRKLTVTEWMSLDGYVSGPNNDMGFVGESFNDEMGVYEDSFLRSGDLLLLGHTTYDSFYGAWPEREQNSTEPGEKEYAKYLNAMKKIVYSKTMDKAEWTNTQVRKEIDPDEIKQWKATEGKNIIIYGSATLVQKLTNLGLIDEYQIVLMPTVLGDG